MIEAIFEVRIISPVEYSIEAINEEAKDIVNKLNELNIPVFNFILNSANTLTMNRLGCLIYEVDISETDIIIEELKRKV